MCTGHIVISYFKFEIARAFEQKEKKTSIHSYEYEKSRRIVVEFIAVSGAYIEINFGDGYKNEIHLVDIKIMEIA